MLVPTEHIEQVVVVNWMRTKHPKHWIFAIPNGEKRHMSVAKRLKAEGVTSGVPDLFIPSLRLWIEMKRIKGSKTTQEQKDWIKYLNDCGYSAFICNGAEAAKAVISDIIKVNAAGQST